MYNNVYDSILVCKLVFKCFFILIGTSFLEEIMCNVDFVKLGIEIPQMGLIYKMSFTGYNKIYSLKRQCKTSNPCFMIPPGCQ